MVWGDTRRFQIDITDDLGDPVDLTTGDLIVTGKSRVRSADPLFSKVVGDGITLDDDVDGRAELVLDPQDLAEIDNTWARLVFDVRFWQAGAGFTPIRGTLYVVPGIGEEGS